ncbi:hypothetical protein QTI66_07680 [Variovorax sp. J22R133]|uniref:hypothetical protein n=1 Tax=Variovorax brevis TaxID=3053503 RepID=UPI002578AB79|nr:hypothetical protein [Variovorax sp. J22R133]MDM0112024.1 hypothetical protein [Variovorax sp. J22R133]
MNTQQTALNEERKASIVVKVTDAAGACAVVSSASIALFRKARGKQGPHPKPQELHGHAVPERVQLTNQHGVTVFDGLEPDYYAVAYLNYPAGVVSEWVNAEPGCATHVHLEPPINAAIATVVQSDDCQPLNCRQPRAGDNMVTTLTHAAGLNATIIAPPGTMRLRSDSDVLDEFAWTAHQGRLQRVFTMRIPLSSQALGAGGFASAPPPAELDVPENVNVIAQLPVPVTGNVGVSLTRTETENTPDLPLWVAIRSGTEALSFNNYLHYMDLLFCAEDRQAVANAFPAEKRLFHQLKGKRFLPFTDTDAYRVLKAATEAFVMVNCAVLREPDFDRRDDNAYLDRRDLPPIGNFDRAFERYLEPLGVGQGNDRVLPYLALIRRKLPDIPITNPDRVDDSLCVGFVQDKLANPCLVELIWSYWLEEAMLVQTMNAVTRRFQNIRSPGTPDPLANLEIDPLRPLNNLIWGYTQDEQHRLTVNRRNYEYDHQYGLRLHGRAIRSMRAADTRSPFLEAFHHLLRLCTVFFKQDDDTTVKADAFPVLNALKEVHLVMSQGAHNQFGDLPSTARIEMLMQQWLLARPEFREFLPTRIMVAYPEPWMDRVDAMKKIQGWTDTSVVHFRNLAIFGEQLLLSIRYGAWSEVFEPTQAFNWARFWRPQIQGYNHAFWAATGVELSGENADKTADATLPSLLLQKRLAVQQRTA